MEEKKKWVILMGIKISMAGVLLVFSFLYDTPYEQKAYNLSSLYQDLFFPMFLLIWFEVPQIVLNCSAKTSRFRAYQKSCSVGSLILLAFATVIYFYAVWPTQKFFSVFLLYSVGVEIYKMKNADKLYLKE